MAIESRAFKGTPETAAHYQPFIAPERICRTGAFIGTNLRTRAPEYFDPWWLKVNGAISGAIFLLTGDREGGKSTLMKALALRLLRLQASKLVEEDGVEFFEVMPELMRAQFNARKTEDGVSEIKPISDFLYSTVYSLNQQSSFNIYDPAMGMSEFDHVEVSVNFCESDFGDDLPIDEVQAIMVAVRTMLVSATKPSPEVLENILRTQTGADLDAYFESNNTRLDGDAQDAADKRPETLPVTLSDPETARKKLHHIREEDFLAASSRVAMRFGRLLRGDYGGIIGGDTSLNDILRSQMLTLDWTGVNDKAISIMQSMMMRWQMSALDNNLPGLIPHLIFNDEVGDHTNNVMFMRSWATRIAKARAFPTAEFTAAQYRNQIAMAGEAGSMIRSLARNIMLGIGAEFIFRQSSDEDVLHELTTRGLSEQDAWLTTQLGTGEVGIKYPDRPLQLVQIHIGPTIKSLVASNSATERMAKRHSIYEFAAIQRRMALLEQSRLEAADDKAEKTAENEEVAAYA